MIKQQNYYLITAEDMIVMEGFVGLRKYDYDITAEELYN